MNKLKLSVVIPNYNGELLLDNCLQSVLEQEFKDYEIIVVDDFSNDRSVPILERYPVRTLVNERNLGFATTVNRGIAASDGEYVLLLNNDVVLGEDFLKSLLETIESDENIFSVSSKMLRYYERDKIDDTGDQYTVYGWVYKRGDGDPEDFFTLPDEVFSACAGAAVYRKSLIEELGYFDSLHESYLEDVDIGWRARINGYKNLYQPKAICYHIGSATLADGERYSSKKVNLSARNNIYIIYKNMPLFQLVLNLPALLLGFGIKYLYFLRRGFAKSYHDGIIEGLKGVKNLKRVSFNLSNLKNYFKIELRMIESSVSYTVDKLIKAVAHPFENLKKRFRKKRALSME